MTQQASPFVLEVPADVSALPRQLFYDGAFQIPHGGYRPVVCPATQQDLGLAAHADARDVDAAVRAAQAAFPNWRDALPVERSKALYTLAAGLRADAEQLALLDALNGGNPLSETRIDVEIAARMIEYYAGLAGETKGHTLPQGPDRLNYSIREPLGVVARIVAYNHPLMFLAAKLAPAVAAGNTVVMKAAEQTPLSAYALARIVARCFPPGVVNFLTGGIECGQALTIHPLVKKVTLIGSTSTGAAVLHAAADKIMPVTLELGGKNPLVICPDADIDRAIDGAVKGMNLGWAGQSCGSTSRCFVHRSVYERVVAGLAERAQRNHRCGLPTDPETTMGCLISRSHFEKVLDLIASAKAEGARLVCGGERSADPRLVRGWYIEPTIFADVTPDMRLFREEVFGPVLAVIPWDDEQRLLEAVNAVEYGLTASIWTRDLVQAHRLAARIEAGYVWINDCSHHFQGADFGGYKKSGLGREEGLAELIDFTQSKNVNVRLT